MITVSVRILRLIQLLLVAFQVNKLTRNTLLGKIWDLWHNLWRKKEKIPEISSISGIMSKYAQKYTF